MSDTTQNGRRAVVVNLAVYRAGRRETRPVADPAGRRLIALRLPSPRALAHRRRMLAHLATPPTASSRPAD